MADARKNLGPAGVTFVIIKNDFLNNVVADRMIPTMLRYQNSRGQRIDVQHPSMCQHLWRKRNLEMGESDGWS